MNRTYEVTVSHPSGWQTRELPRPASQGSGPRRTYPVGTRLQVRDIKLFDGVPYAELFSSDGPEWGRLGEAGYLRFSEPDNRLILQDSIKHYAVPVELNTYIASPSSTDNLSEEWIQALNANTQALNTFTEVLRKHLEKS